MIKERNLLIGKYKEEGQTMFTKVFVDIEIKETTKDKINYATGKTLTEPQKILSISGHTKIGNRDESGGQIHDTIKENLDIMEFEVGFSKKDISKLIDIWERYHLNDLQSGTKKQTDFLNDFYKISSVERSYENDVKLLENEGLLVDNGYSYGSNWLIEILPTNLEKELTSIISTTTEKEKTTTIKPV